MDHTQSLGSVGRDGDHDKEVVLDSDDDDDACLAFASLALLRKRRKKKLLEQHQKRRRWWVRPWLLRKGLYDQYETLMQELATEDGTDYA